MKITKNTIILIEMNYGFFKNNIQNISFIKKKIQFNLKEGTKKIYDRYDAGKKTLTDMIQIFKLRVEGEEKFIKDLTMIGNKTHSLREGG